MALFFKKSGLPDWAVLALISMTPAIELRGGVPVGSWLGLSPGLTFVICVLGNMAPIAPMLLALRSDFFKARPHAFFAHERTSSLAARHTIASNPATPPSSRLPVRACRVWLACSCCMWWRAQKLAKPLLSRAEKKLAGLPTGQSRTLALALFVGVPAPGTGAWTGAIIAYLLDMPFTTAMASIFAGVALAGVIMTILTVLGKAGALIALGVLVAGGIGAIVSSKD